MPRLFFYKMMKRNSLPKKMMLTICGIILLPLFSIQLFTLVESAHTFESMNQSQYFDSLQSLSNSFSDQMATLSSSAVELSLNDIVRRPLRTNINGYTLYAAAKAIDEYSKNNLLVDAAGILYRPLDRVLYQRYSRSLGSFCSARSSSESAVEMLAFFESLDSLDYFSTANYTDCADNILIVARPVSLSGTFTRNAVAFFTIDLRALETWCANFIPTSSSFAILTEENGFLLRGSDFSFELTGSPAFQSFLQDPAQTIFTVDPQQDSLIYKYADARSGMVVLASMARSVTEVNLINYINRVRVILVFTIILSCILVLITLYVNCIPILKMMAKHVKVTPGNRHRSDLDLIDSAFFARDERISQQNDLLETFIISDLLSGEHINEKMLDRYFPATQYRTFVVVAAYLNLPSGQLRQVSELAGETLAGKVVSTSIPYRVETLCVFMSDGEADPAALKAGIQHAIAQTVGYECGVTVGSAVHDIRQIQTSYHDALMAGRPAKEALDMQYPSDLVKEFSRQLRVNNQVRTIDILNQLEPLAQGLEPTARQFLYFDLLHAYFIWSAGNEEVVPNAVALRMIPHLNGSQLLRILRHSIGTPDSAADRSDQSAIREMQRELLEYVDSNCLDSSLCLMSAADYLGTSIYTVSRIFKETTGQGFKEYITDKRLQHACHLLSTTRQTVSTIAAASGFENATYFTTIFKNKYGIPPTKYRANAAARRAGDDCLKQQEVM